MGVDDMQWLGRVAFRSNTNVHRQMNGQNVVYTRNGILFSLKKESGPDIRYNMDDL